VRSLASQLLRQRVVYRVNIYSDRRRDIGIVTGYRKNEITDVEEIEVTNAYVRWIHPCQIVRIIPPTEPIVD